MDRGIHMDDSWSAGSQPMYNNNTSNNITSITNGTTSVPTANASVNINTNVEANIASNNIEPPSLSTSSSRQMDDPTDRYNVPFLALAPRTSRRSLNNSSETVHAIAAYLNGQADVVFDSNMVASHYRTAVENPFGGSQQSVGSGNSGLPPGVPDTQSILPLAQSIEYIIRHPPPPSAHASSSSSGPSYPQSQLSVEMSRTNTLPMTYSHQTNDQQLSARSRADVEHGRFDHNNRQTGFYPTYYEPTIGSYSTIATDPLLQPQSHPQPPIAVGQPTWPFPSSSLPAHQQQRHTLYQSSGQSRSQPGYPNVFSQTFPFQPNYTIGSSGQGLDPLSTESPNASGQYGHHHHSGFDPNSINDAGLSDGLLRKDRVLPGTALAARSRLVPDSLGRISSSSDSVTGKAVDRRRSEGWTDPGGSPVMPLVSIGESSNISTPQSSPQQGRRKSRKSSTSLPVPSTGTYVGRVEEMIPWNIEVTARDPRKTHVCPVCRRGFARRFNLKAHMSTHDPMRPKPFKCQSCDKRFSRGHDLDRHQQSIHDTIKVEPPEHISSQPTTPASTSTSTVGPSSQPQPQPQPQPSSPSSLSSPDRSQGQKRPEAQDQGQGKRAKT